MDFGAAFSSAAKGASGLLQSSIDDDMKANAEQRAADLKLSVDQRLLAIQEAAKMRAAERFAAIARTKAGEEVPQEAAPVTQLTQEGAQAAGLDTGLQGNADQINLIATRAQDTLKNPNATDSQKADAQGILDQLAKQEGAQAGVNAKDAEGKTRKRTPVEAAKAAINDAMLTDPGAAMAGAGMIKAVTNDDIEQKKLDQRERIEQNKVDQRDRETDRRERGDTLRWQEMMTRIEAGQGGKNGNKTALIQNAEYLKSLGYSDDKIEKFIFDKKELSLEDIAAKILAGDKFGEITPQQAAQKAIAVRDAINASGKTGAPYAPKKLTFDPATGTFK